MSIANQCVDGLTKLGLALDTLTIREFY